MTWVFIVLLIIAMVYMAVKHPWILALTFMIDVWFLMFA